MIEDVIVKQMREVEQLISLRKNELRSLESDLVKIRNIAVILGIEVSTPGRSETVISAEAAEDDFPPTIKEMALSVIAGVPDGLQIDQILNSIQARFGIAVRRQSLPPQLSRLKKRNKIVKEGDVWKIMPGGAG